MRDSDECDGLRTQLVVVFIEAILHQINQVGRIEHDHMFHVRIPTNQKALEDFLESCAYLTSVLALCPLLRNNSTSSIEDHFKGNDSVLNISYKKGVFLKRHIKVDKTLVLQYSYKPRWTLGKDLRETSGRHPWCRSFDS